MAGKPITCNVLDFCGGAALVPPQQTWFKVEGQPVALLGQVVVPHGIGLHAAASVALTTGFAFTIDGITPVRQGDAATCGDTCTGRTWFNVE
jgi:uncharacterized Zn-binding protein involved in type VI secretion